MGYFESSHFHIFIQSLTSHCIALRISKNIRILLFAHFQNIKYKSILICKFSPIICAARNIEILLFAAFLLITCAVKNIEILLFAYFLFHLSIMNTRQSFFASQRFSNLKCKIFWQKWVLTFICILLSAASL